jgi:hypothetical protein
MSERRKVTRIGFVLLAAGRSPDETHVSGDARAMDESEDYYQPRKRRAATSAPDGTLLQSLICKQERHRPSPRRPRAARGSTESEPTRECRRCMQWRFHEMRRIDSTW